MRACASNLQRFYKKSFLWRIVTGDETWVLYDNPDNKKQWIAKHQSPAMVPKRNIHSKKQMLCVWWDMKGILHHELLNPRQTITADLYQEQLKRVQQAILEKRSYNGKGARPTILLHDNARPHTARSAVKTISELGWETLTHPAYSPDLAPSDYHLFRDMKLKLRGTTFTSPNEVENGVLSYFDSKDPKFYSNGIKKLPLRWQKVIESNGNYFH